MNYEVDATLLTAESKDYKFDGKEGVSHKVRLLIAGEIFKCNSNANQVAVLKPSEGKTGIAVVKLESRKEVLSLSLVSFEEN